MVDLSEFHPKIDDRLLYETPMGVHQTTHICRVGSRTIATTMGTWVIETGLLLVDERFKAIGILSAHDSHARMKGIKNGRPQHTKPLDHVPVIHCPSCGGQMEHDGLNAFCPWADCDFYGYVDVPYYEVKIKAVDNISAALTRLHQRLEKTNENSF